MPLAVSPKRCPSPVPKLVNGLGHACRMVLLLQCWPRHPDPLHYDVHGLSYACRMVLLLQCWPHHPDPLHCHPSSPMQLSWSRCLRLCLSQCRRQSK
jgi:hypothetical protein